MRPLSSPSTALVSLLALAPPAAAQLPDVAIVAAATSLFGNCRYTDVQTFLQASGQFASVDVIDCVTTTPALADLAPYEAVLTWSNTDYFDPVALGDLLADYSDAGGAVVVSVFANTSTDAPRHLQGRWVTGGYEIIPAAQGNASDSSSLGAVLVPGHPIMAGVTALSAASAFRPLQSTPLLQGTVVSEWGDGAPLAIAGDTPGRVDLGLYPPPSTCAGAFWDISTNGDLLIANALSFAVSTAGSGIGRNFCSAPPNTTGATGVISAAGSDAVALNDLTLTASSLPRDRFGIFIASRDQGFAPGAGGTSNGNLCLAGTVGMFDGPGQILNTGPGGEYSLRIDLGSIPPGQGSAAAVAGDTWSFQAWHRERVGLGSNFPDGIEITFQ
ncbi:MAG: hypothetical protein VX460_00810 [Planctomycetota bacterium]|nr:hypothetical protein [Planctomycetota bacterium]